MRRDLKPTTFRLSEEARRLLVELAAQKGLSMTGVLEVLLRDEAKRSGIQTPPIEPEGV